MVRFNPTREFYIPKGARKVAHKASSAVAYIYENQGRPAAVVFQGKAQKPAWRYWFKSEATREKRIADFFASVQEQETSKAKRRADASKPHKWEVGLILVSSWGYDQTNIDWYEVIEVPSAHYVVIEKIGGTTATDSQEGISSMSSYVMPDPENRTGRKSRHKVNMLGEPSVCFEGRYHAYAWDGRPRYCSWYA